MIIGRPALALAGVVLGAAVGLPPALAAKNCHKLCATEIRSCITTAKAANDCKGEKGATGRACRKARRQAIKLCGSSKGPILSGCNASTSTSTCS